MNSQHLERDRPLALSIVDQIADRSDARALDLPPLATAVDPDMLDAFVATDVVRPDTNIQFEYAGHDVTVYGDGRVSISGGERHPKQDVG